MKHLSPWKYFFACLFLLALALALGGFFFNQKLEQNLQVLLEEENLRAAELAARILGLGDAPPAVVKEVAALSDARVTIVAADGKVLADSEGSPESMENHADRPEIQAAARTGWGHAIRTSTTIGTEMLYTAVRLDGAAGKPGRFVRLSRTIRRVHEVTLSFSELVWTAVPLVVLLGVLAFYFFIELRIARYRRLL